MLHLPDANRLSASFAGFCSRPAITVSFTRDNHSPDGFQSVSSVSLNDFRRAGSFFSSFPRQPPLLARASIPCRDTLKHFDKALDVSPFRKRTSISRQSMPGFGRAGNGQLLKLLVVYRLQCGARARQPDTCSPTHAAYLQYRIPDRHGDDRHLSRCLLTSLQFADKRMNHPLTIPHEAL